MIFKNFFYTPVVFWPTCFIFSFRAALQNGKEIKADDKRVIFVSDKKKRRLVIKDTLLSDAGEITARTNTDDASARLDVKRERN